jgi:hypothetical protein
MCVHHDDPVRFALGDPSAGPADEAMDLVSCRRLVEGELVAAASELV